MTENNDGILPGNNTRRPTPELGSSIKLVPVNQETTSQNISRREFLRRAGATALAAPLIASAAERFVIQGINDMLTSRSTDEMVASMDTLTDIDSTTENPNFRHIYDVISDGITDYQAKTGRTVSYTRSRGYRDINYYSNVLSKIQSSITLPRSPDDIFASLTEKMPYEAYQAYLSSDLRMGSFPEIFATGSGMYNRFKNQQPDLFNDKGQVIDWTSYFAAAEKHGSVEIDNAKKMIEAEKQNTGKPVSSSLLLEYFLESNNGDLAQSIYDTNLFLKLMARNNAETGAMSVGEENVQWLKDNIQDEYGGPSYVNPPQGQSAVNLIGKPYHSWNLVTLTNFFPVEVVHAAGVYRQLSTLSDQGLAKTKSDLQTLQDLRQTDALLTSYSQSR